MKKIIYLSFILLLSACSPIHFSYSNQAYLEYGEDPLSLITQSDADIVEIAYFDQNRNPIDQQSLQINEEYILVFYVKKGKQEKQFETSITFCDTQAPLVSIKKNLIELEYGASFNQEAWCQENLEMQDNYTPKEKLIIKGFDQLSSFEEGNFDLSIEDENQNSTIIRIQVVLLDTTPPTITAKKTTFSINENDPLPDFASFASAWDNKDKEVPIQIKNNSIQGPGKYQLYFSATDQAQNEAILPFTVIIHQTIPQESIIPEATEKPDFKEDFYDQDQKNLNACIELGKQSGSCNWECIPNGDGTYIYMQYD